MNDLNRRWILRERPVGKVTAEHFQREQAPLPQPKTGELLVRNMLLSFDPAQRGWLSDRASYVPPVALGDVMRANTVGRVVVSKHSDFREGDIVRCVGGWQDYCLVLPGSPPQNIARIPPNVSPEMSLSVLGVTGLTAYWGMLDIGRPKPGDVVLVSGAAGATGSVAGQIAKIAGCTVIGVAGGPEKCAWLLQEAGFDAAIDYTTGELAEKMAELAPDGAAIAFDNVGGHFLEAALDNLAHHARVVLCGSISSYESIERPHGPRNLIQLVVRRAEMRGFVVLDYLDRSRQAAQHLHRWVSEGRIAYQVDVQNGFDNIPETLMRLFAGKNKGKQLLQLD